MNLVLILLLQTLGTVIGVQVIFDRSMSLGKLNTRKGRKNDRHDRERSNTEEGNKTGGFKRRKENDKTEKWVVDSIFYEDYQSDSPTNTMASLDICPPVPDVITDDACAQSSCQKDTDCWDGYRCCFTGCSFTCLPEIKPPALVDWRKEPRRSRSGIAWLISDRKSASSSEGNPEALISTLSLNKTMHLGLRGGRQEHTIMLWGDLELGKTNCSNGRQYKDFTEEATNTEKGLNGWEQKGYITVPLKAI